MLKSLIILAAIAFIGSSASLAAVRGQWVATSQECNYAVGERDAVNISGSRITGLEWSCDVLSQTTKNGYTVARASCGAEGEDITVTLRYKLDGQGLHFKWGKRAERVFKAQCQ